MVHGTIVAVRYAMGKRRKRLANHKGITAIDAKMGIFDPAQQICAGGRKSTQFCFPSLDVSRTRNAAGTGNE